MREEKLDKFINRETELYLVFGVLTTVVNFGTYLVFDWLLGQDYYLISNILSFVFATMFAFVTNKKFVFQSEIWKWELVIKEAVSFVSARIGTFVVVEEIGLWIAVHFLKINMIHVFYLDGILLAKILLAFVAVLVNYILSKFFIFKKN
ncbi:GtrA family protein [Lachnospiraceae bacterium WCA-9-b2]|uniref:GtrA family protein n=1 Tax=Sporofaciens musculi TaxID=2681861 RepID=A0A7X3MIK7_9FIRM|nr:GtrA family protein [Sporofaciens musculi]MXP76940.1 GtrA family protein [Sporofaciens musculi]